MRALLAALLPALVLVLLAASGPVEAKPSVEELQERTAARTVFNSIGGGAEKGAWTVGIQGGYPWLGLRGQLGVGKRLAPVVELETALFRRWRPSVGLAISYVKVPRFRLTGEVLLGWLIQQGDARRLGPQGILRIRLSFPWRRVAPYLILGTRHALLFDRRAVTSPDGTDTSWTVRHNWTGWASFGAAIAIVDAVGIDIGIDWPWVDAPSVSIPGFHLGVHVGGG